MPTSGNHDVISVSSCTHDENHKGNTFKRTMYPQSLITVALKIILGVTEEGLPKGPPPPPPPHPTPPAQKVEKKTVYIGLIFSQLTDIS